MEDSKKHETAEKLFYAGLNHTKAERHQAAEACFRECLVLFPERLSVIANLGSNLLLQKKHSEAWEVLNKGAQLFPEDPTLLYSLAIANHQNFRTTEAVQIIRKLIESEPSNPAYLNSLGSFLRSQKNYKNAEQYFRAALALHPDYSEAKTNLGYLLLGQSLFTEGWKLTEERFNRQSNPIKPPAPLENITPWNGKATQNQIVVYSEQGFGDVIQFARFIRHLQKKHKHILFLVPPKLRRLMHESFGSAIDVETTYTPTKNNQVVRVSLLSLPYQLKLNTKKELSTEAPYLKISKESWGAGSNQPQENQKIKAGICWRGNPSLATDHKRSIPLSQFQPLLKNKSVHWESLVPDTRPDEKNLISADSSSPNSLNSDSDFHQTAVLISQLDFIVTVDSVVAHLGGALGKPTFLLNRYESEWRWGYPAQEDTYWYASITIINQLQEASWDATIALLEEKISGFLQPQT